MKLTFQSKYFFSGSNEVLLQTPSHFLIKIVPFIKVQLLIKGIPVVYDLSQGLTYMVQMSKGLPKLRIIFQSYMVQKTHKVQIFLLKIQCMVEWLFFIGYSFFSDTQKKLIDRSQTCHNHCTQEIYIGRAKRKTTTMILFLFFLSFQYYSQTLYGSLGKTSRLLKEA